MPFYSETDVESCILRSLADGAFIGMGVTSYYYGGNYGSMSGRQSSYYRRGYGAPVNRAHRSGEDGRVSYSSTCALVGST
jgi:hypothetical protein